jgi:hypothetical protein
MSEFKDLEMIKAADLVNHPEKADQLEGKFRTVWDLSLKGGGAYNNLEKAMNILGAKGWRPITMAVSAIPAALAIFVIMEKVS